MPFIASNGLTEAGPSKTVVAGRVTGDYHHAGSGDPVLGLPSDRPGTNAWPAFHNAVGELSRPRRENIRRYLRVHSDDESLVTDEVVDYIRHAHMWSREFIAARGQSVSLPHDYTPELPGIVAPVLLIHGRYDRMVAFEVSIAILNHIADSRLVLLNNCGHWPPFEKPAEWAAQVLAFLRGY